MDFLNNIVEWSSGLLGLNPADETRLLKTIGIILALIILRRILLWVVYYRTKDVGVRYHWRKITSYLVFVVIVFVVGSLWIKNFHSISTYLGIVSAGLAIALQAPLTNLAGWIFIMWRRPFAVGDRIQVGELRGDVIDQGIFIFSVMEIGNWVDAEQSTGRVVHVPNGKVFSEHVSNYEEGFRYIWNEITVRVTFESDWEKAKALLLDICNRRDKAVTEAAEREVKAVAGKMMIYLTKLTPIVYTAVKEWGVALTVRYLCEPRNRRGSEQEMWEEVLREIAKHDDIQFAYPTQRFFLRPSEQNTDSANPVMPSSGGSDE
ncbi:MAG: mechanosensitive ion channel family protein [Pyrinomonadaceae bacterium]